MTPAERARALACCDAEIARIDEEGATGKCPAWLIALAHNDWAVERLMISRGCEPNWPARDYDAIKRAIEREEEK